MLAAAAAAYLPLTLLGFGSDIDSYLVVETGVRLLEEGTYRPSRTPGFLVYEVGSAALVWLGGSVASNLGSAAMALVAVASFLGLCRRWAVPHRHLLALAFALHPFVWVNAASTMDYLWALGFGLAGGVLLLDRRWLGAGLVFGLAIGTRLTTVLVVAPFLVYALTQRRADWRGLALTALLAFGLGGLCYVPSLLAYQGLGLLEIAGTEEQATWTWAAHLGRFVYKNIYLWGLPAALVLAGLAVRAVRRARQRPPSAVLALCLSVIGLYELFYLRYPLEQEYILPVIPFVLIGLGLSVGRRGLVLFCALVLAYNLVSVNLARPDRPNMARSVDYGLWAEPGYLADDTRQRLLVLECATATCWLENWIGRRSEISAPVGR